MQETPVWFLGSGRSIGEGIGYPLQYSWASLVAQLVKNLPAMRETWVDPWVGKIPWRRERLLTPVFWPGEFHGLYSLGSQVVGHDWASFTSLDFYLSLVVRLLEPSDQEEKNVIDFLTSTGKFESWGKWEAGRVSHTSSKAGLWVGSFWQVTWTRNIGTPIRKPF